MNKTPLCTILISSQVPPDEIDSLETSLRMNSIGVQKSPNRIMGADDIVFIAAVMGGLNATVSLIKEGVKVAKAIKQWRQKVHSQGINPEGRLEHPQRPPLNLSEATDEEIDEWFFHK